LCSPDSTFCGGSIFLSEILHRIIYSNQSLVRLYSHDILLGLEKIHSFFPSDFMFEHIGITKIPCFFDFFKLMTSLDNSFMTSLKSSIFSLYGIFNPEESPFIISLRKKDAYSRIIKLLTLLNKRTKDFEGFIDKPLESFSQEENLVLNSQIECLFLTDCCDNTIDERILNLINEYTSKKSNWNNLRDGYLKRKKILLSLHDSDQYNPLFNSARKNFLISDKFDLIMIADNSPSSSFYAMWALFIFPVLVFPYQGFFILLCL
jgi:hypothetical protein